MEEPKKIAGSLLTLKGIEAKLQPLIAEIEKEITGVQVALILAVPDIDEVDTLACTAYINMDIELLLTAVKRKMADPLDKLPQVS
jgi:hypothetical protein